MAVHFLDDGVLAGDLAAVAVALRQVQQQAAGLGLSLNLAKCELVTLGPVAPEALAASFPEDLLKREDGASRILRHFDFLGAAIGDSAFVQAHTERCVVDAGKLLEALSELEDPQVGLRLLRACAGYTRMVHSMRCNPPAAQVSALRAFDRQLALFCWLDGHPFHCGAVAPGEPRLCASWLGPALERCSRASGLPSFAGVRHASLGRLCCCGDDILRYHCCPYCFQPAAAQQPGPDLGNLLGCQAA